MRVVGGLLLLGAAQALAVPRRGFGVWNPGAVGARLRKAPRAAAFPVAPSAGGALDGVGGEAHASAAVLNVAAIWGVLGVLSVLVNGMKRLVPIALEPFAKGDFGLVHWAAYAGFAAFMAYAEGFKGFQRKFCPFVVRRAALLAEPGARAIDRVLAPPFCMGLFHANRKRRIVSWSLLVGIFAIVQGAKRLAYPYNAIIDGGAVVGLGWGCIALGTSFVKAMRGELPHISPELPEDSTY